MTAVLLDMKTIANRCRESGILQSRYVMTMENANALGHSIGFCKDASDESMWPLKLDSQNYPAVRCMDLR